MAITFVMVVPDSSDADDVTQTSSIGPWDVSAAGDNSVTAQLEQNRDGTYVLHITGEGPMKDFAKTAAAAVDNKPYFRDAIPWWNTDALERVTIDDEGTIYDGEYIAGITSIIIDDGITRIGSSVFSFMRDVISITIPDTVTSIGDRALMSNYSLESITIPDSVVMNEIYGSNEDRDGELLAAYCPSLESVTLGSGFTVIPCRAFENSNIGLDDLNMDFSRINKIGNNAFLVGSGAMTAETLDLKPFSNLTELASNIFNGWVVDTLELPSSVTTIGTNLCPAAKHINFEDLVNLSEFGNQQNTSLVSVDLSNTGLTALPWHGFYGCSDLQTVILSSKIVTFGSQQSYDQVFYGMAQGSRIYVPDGYDVSLLEGMYEPERTSVVISGSGSASETAYIGVMSQDGTTEYYPSFVTAADAAVTGDTIFVAEGYSYTMGVSETAFVFNGIELDSSILNVAVATFEIPNGTAYSGSLKAAAEGCPEYGTITLQKDTETTEAANITRDMTVDLNGKKATSTVWAPIFSISVDLTVTIENGILDNTYTDGLTVDVNDGVHLTVTNLIIGGTDSDGGPIRLRESVLVIGDNVTLGTRNLSSNEHWDVSAGSYVTSHPIVYFMNGYDTSVSLINTNYGQWTVYFLSDYPTGTVLVPSSGEYYANYFFLGTEYDGPTDGTIENEGYIPVWKNSDESIPTTLTNSSSYLVDWVQSTKDLELTIGTTKDLASSNDGITVVSVTSSNPSVVSVSGTTLNPVGTTVDPVQIAASVTNNAGVEYTMTYNVTVVEGGLSPTGITGITFDIDGQVYGDTSFPINGTFGAQQDVGDFTVTISGTTADSESFISVGTFKSGDTADSQSMSGGYPTVPGDYVVSISATGTQYYVYEMRSYSVAKAPLTITAKDWAGNIWEIPKDIGYEVSGLVSDDAVSDVVLSYSDDVVPGGAYDIEVGGYTVTNANYYQVSTVNGTLTVSELPITMDRTDVQITADQGYASASGNFTVTNTGDEQLVVSVTTQSVFFTLTSQTLTLDAGASTTVTVTPSEGLTGQYGATVVLSIGGVEIGTIDVTFTVISQNITVSSDQDSFSVHIEDANWSDRDTVVVIWNGEQLTENVDYTLSEGSIIVEFTQSFIQKMRNAGGEEQEISVQYGANGNGMQTYSVTVESVPVDPTPTPDPDPGWNPGWSDDDDDYVPPVIVPGDTSSSDDDTVKIVACAAAAVVAAIMAAFLILGHRRE